MERGRSGGPGKVVRVGLVEVQWCLWGEVGWSGWDWVKWSWVDGRVERVG